MRIFNWVLLVIFVLGVVLLSNWLGQQAYSWLPIAATAEAEPVGDLLSFLVTLGSIVFFGVLGVLIYSILFYRASSDDTNDAIPIRGNLKLEVIWTVIPILLVMWIASYSYGIYQRMNILGAMPIVHLHDPISAPAQAQSVNSAASTEETIEVIAKQWHWTFRYPDQNVTSTELHLPVNQRVHLALQSEDVIHGFYVPNFRIKQDIIPNRTIELQFTPNRVGQYQLQDSQFSGTYFAVMQANVYIESPENYAQWLSQAASQPATATVDKATSEHTQPSGIPMRSHWPTVPPANPPLVNPTP